MMTLFGRFCSTSSPAKRQVMTYEHLRSACLYSDPCFDSIHELVYQIASDKLALPLELTDSAGIPLVKPNRKLRPICVGEVLLRLAAAYTIALHGNIGQHLGHKQLAVDVS